MKRTLIMSVLVLTIASLAWGQNVQKKPNLSGTWKLNAEKTDLHGLPAFTMVQTIKHQNANFEIGAIVNGKETSAPKTFEIGGSAVSIDSDDATAKFWWEGQSLHSEIKWKAGDVQKDIRTLSEDGKTMTDMRTITKPQGFVVKMTLVLEKQ